MMNRAASTCRSCGAPIEWAVTRKGRRMPLDPVVMAGGEPIVETRRIAGEDVEVAIPAQPANANLRVYGEAPTGEPLVETVAPGAGDRISHFATCPNAGKHRKGRRHAT